MKQRNKKFLQRLIALLLTVVLIGSNSSLLEVFARPTDGNMTHVGSVTQGQDPAQSGNAAGNGTGASYDFDIKSFADTSQCISSRAYLVTIQKLENNSCVPHKI